MNLYPKEEKIKPFRLVKYFTFSSLILIFVGTIALSFFNTYGARTMQQKKSEEYARLLIENLNHQVFLQFIIPVALKFGKIQLREKEQYFARVKSEVLQEAFRLRDLWIVDFPSSFPLWHILSTIICSFSSKRFIHRLWWFHRSGFWVFFLIIYEAVHLCRMPTHYLRQRLPVI